MDGLVVLSTTQLWLAVPPAAFSGLVIANEVLDAMPVPLLVRQDGLWLERGVSVEHEGFVFADRPCAQVMADQIPEAGTLPDGYVTEVHPQQVAFVHMLADMLRAGEGGAALLIDYGFPSSTYYLPERSAGTLMCHYQHHAHVDPFFLPGLQDITSHIDFSALARAGLDAGLNLGFYTTQAAFLLATGLTSLLEPHRANEPRYWLPLSNAIQKLTSPAEMGELFKVMLLVDRLEVPLEQARQNQSYRL